ncbi:muconolactone Delta-isomerase [Prauserella endophytica]|uniref:Muconolactone Delta-isomerase n=1 Tax=Prauserella endophytica TaxID=1592324 RepID=A0ABY2S8S3_9PSEU|nr:muconolactone Delta-isomerase family protein [Prauserella endophytica]TKG71699.1 muconolactone delta-isomerase [Prauserella endophytica]
MEFLVRLTIDVPRDLSHDEFRDLMASEQKRGEELISQGLLRSIWRVPGARANISLYDVKDATALHETLTSLPMWPWMTAEVQPLATHPLTVETSDRPA